MVVFNKREWNMKIFKAFTLAEVLITLGIVGVISAMTIPSLMFNIRERETVSKLIQMERICQINLAAIYLFLVTRTVL